MTYIKIPFVRPVLPSDDATLLEIRAILASGQVTNYAAKVREFEREMASFLGRRQVIAISNASSGLLLSLMATRKRTGKVILPAFTFMATLNAILSAGHEPVFCDIDPRDFTMDPEHLRDLIKSHTDIAAVIPVNVFGVPPDLKTIHDIVKDTGIHVLYDNAHGMGTLDKRVGSQPLTDVDLISLHATKVFPVGEGGLAVTNDPSLAEKMRKLINHGLHPDVQEIEHGLNAKMDEIKAILGLNKLQTFPSELADRRSNALLIRSVFSRYPGFFSVQEIPKGVVSNFQNLGILINDPQLTPEHLIEKFQQEGIQTRRYFHPLLTALPRYQHVALPRSEEIWNRLISFPIHSRMSKENLAYIEKAIENVVQSIGFMEC